MYYGIDDVTSKDLPHSVSIHALLPVTVSYPLQGADGVGKCTLGRYLGPFPQETVTVPLSEHIYSLVFTGKQELSLCQYFVLQLGKIWGEA